MKLTCSMSRRITAAWSKLISTQSFSNFSALFLTIGTFINTEYFQSCQAGSCSLKYCLKFDVQHFPFGKMFLIIVIVKNSMTIFLRIFFEVLHNIFIERLGFNFKMSFWCHSLDPDLADLAGKNLGFLWHFTSDCG